MLMSALEKVAGWIIGAYIILAVIFSIAVFCAATGAVLGLAVSWFIDGFVHLASMLSGSSVHPRIP